MSLDYSNFTLPDSVVTKRDFYRLIKELEAVDSSLLNGEVLARIGENDSEQINMTDQLSQFIQHNHIDLEDSGIRSDAIKQTRLLKDRIAVFRITLAQPAKQDQLTTLIKWLRSTVNPQVVLVVGLQPGLVAGAHIRTANRIFDLSFRASLEKNRHVLVDEIAKVARSVA